MKTGLLGSTALHSSLPTRQPRQAGFSIWALVAAVPILLLVSANPSRAVTPPCGTTISTPDVTVVFDSDMVCPAGFTGTALTIRADRVTVDGAGFRIVAPEAAIVVGASSVRDLVLQHLDLSGNSGTGIRLSVVTTASIAGIDASGTTGTGYGVDTWACTGVTITGSAIHRRAYAVYLHGFAHTVSANNLSDNAVGIVAGATAPGNSYIDNDFSRSSSWAMQFGGSGDFLLSGNTFTDSANGLSFHTVDGMTLTGLDFSTARIPGTVLSLTLVTNSEVTGIDASGTNGTGSGIWTRACTNVTVSNNVVHGRYYGVGFDNNTLSMARANDLTDNAVGILAGGPGPGNAYVDNDVSRSTSWAMQFGGSGDFMLSGNTFTDSANGLSFHTVDGMTLTGLDFSTARIPGTVLSLTLVTNSMVTGINASGSDGLGSGIKTRCSSGTTFANIIVHGRAWGLALDSDTNNIITGNDLTGNSYGIQAWGGSGNTYSNNDVSYSVFAGLTLSGGTGATVRENLVTAGLANGLVLGLGGGTALVYHNNIFGNAGRQISSSSSIELSFNGEGNYWGRACPEPLFVAGVDSNGPDVVDSFPYGTPDGWLTQGPGCAPPPPAIPASERAALIGLYEATDGAHWGERTNWRNPTDTDFNDTGTECTWFGVSCDPTQTTVTAVYLNGNNLNGTLPARLVDLTNLEFLWLSANQGLTGPIPESYGSFATLHTFVIAGARLTGSIPSSFGGLSNLRYLDLNWNLLEGPIPSELGNLTGLEDLRLLSNQLNGEIPENLRYATKLRILFLAGNRLTGRIPGWLADLSDLDELDLMSNLLTGDIPPLATLTKLRRLHVDYNPLNVGPIPDWLATMSQLVVLGLGGTNRTGEIPPWLAGLDNVEYLGLDNNQLTGLIPRELGEMAALDYLRLDHNDLTGGIPPALGAAPRLRFLYLGQNRLSGALPPELGALARLQGISIAGNALQGPIPAAWLGLTNLFDQSSDLRWNALYTNDPALRAFLNLKQSGGDWESSQTTAPADVRATTMGLDAIELSWDPIVYTAEGGGYRILFATSPGGPYELFATTPDKTRSSMTIAPLPPGTRYFFVIQTVTYPWWGNKNTVESEPSAEVSAETPPPPPAVSVGDATVVEGDAGVITIAVPVWLSEPPAEGASVQFATADLSATAGSDYLPATGLVYFNPGEVAATIELQIIGDLRQEDDETFLVTLFDPANAVVGRPEGVVTILNDDVNIPLSERNALIAIYNSTNGAEWTRRTNWRNATDTDFNQPGTECTWFTVTCNAEQSHVVSVWLGWNNPSGVLPPEVGDLTELQTFVTAPGSISGEVPATLANLSRMRYLDLNWNLFSGEIGPILQAMPLLEDLRLGGNHFEGEVLPSILGCARLRILLLGGNQFTGVIPSELGDLQDLEALSLGPNHFSGPIPAALGRLTRLRGLELTGNDLVGGIPDELGQLTALVELSLGFNRLLDPGPIPVWIGGLADLSYLDLRNMNLTGQVPAFLGGLLQLRNLYLSQNHLVGTLPPELGGLTNLYALFVNGNALVGPVPTSFLNLVTLTESDLTYNGLHTDDPALAALLARAQCCNWDWTHFQTVPPKDLAATLIGPDSVQLSWTPIRYTGDSGGYRVLMSTSPSGPHAEVGITADKTADRFVVGGLPYGPTYFFVVQTVTYPHGSNPNTVESELSGEVVVTLMPPIPDLVINDAAVVEGNDGVVMAQLVVALSEPSPEVITVEYVSADGDALAGSDYLPVSGILTFNPGDGSALIEVPVIGDILEEPYETFQVLLANAVNATIVRSPAVVTIANDDLNIPLSERDALIALYNATNGPGWSSRTNWRNADDTDFNAPGTECTWGGISCNADGSHVTAITLWWNNLTGDLAGSWGAWIPALANLEFFSVYQNALSGVIPTEFATLPNLTELTLDFNHFAGGVPEVICTSRSITRLNLGFNQLSGPIPSCLGDMTQLVALELFNNQFTGSLPDSLGSLTAMEFLSLGNNLAMDDEAVPTWLAGLTSIRYLDLRAMNFTGPVPLFLVGLRNLENLYLSGNKLTGVIPPEFGSMTGLKELYLDANRLTGGIPPELGTMAAVRVLSLGDQPLGGEIPETLGQLSELWAFGIVNANLEGPIPESFGNLHKLAYLSLFGNHLSGPIPSTIGGLASLEELWLWSNDLEGPIPPEIGQLSKLRGLHLVDNRLSGRLPIELGNLTQLCMLQIGGNTFTGPVPDSLLNLTGLLDGWSRFSFNGLYTDNADLEAFLDRIECCGWHFSEFQTVPPDDVTVTAVGTDSVQLAWTPIEYTGGNGGGYRVFYSTSAGGPYTLFGITPDKTVGSMEVTGLADGLTYYFVVQSVTFAGWFNDNTVESELSAEVVATTLPANEPPVVDAGADLAAVEGQAFTITASLTDANLEDTHTATIDWGDGTSEPGAVVEAGGSGTVSGSHTYAENGSFAVTVTVLDSQGGTGSDTTVVAVVNSAPAAGPIGAPLDPVQLGSRVTATAAFGDSGVLDTHTAVWEWGDGESTPGAVMEANGAGSVTGEHVYAAAGVYTLTLTVTDDEGATGWSLFRYVVVYDPKGGFVTGGGWITSPPGAYVADPTLTGKANFGFVSKYQKGASVPTGTTQFQFRAAGLNFHSATYQWLVIAGARAKYKGTGTINGGGSFGFMLTAIDGDVSGGGGQDKFRIKIWDAATSDLVYDNLIDAPDDADPTTVIGGGSIVIHKEK